MKLLFFIFTFSLFSFAAQAADIDKQINKACLRHAVSLVSQLKADVVNGMSQNQSDQALKIATETCQAYFKKEFSQNPEVVANTDNSSKDDDDGVTDWLTEKILSGDSTRKEGNKRLDRIK